MTVENLKVCCRHSGFPHHVFRECLGAFQLSVKSARAETGDIHRFQRFVQPKDKGQFRSGDDKSYLVVAGKSDNALYVVILEGDVGAQKGGSTIARRNEQVVQKWALTDLPCQGVFPSTGSNYKNIQTILLWSNSDGNERSRSGV